MHHSRFVLALAAAAAAAFPAVGAAHPAAAPTLSVSAGTVPFGKAVTLRGVVANAPAGQEVDILTQACGFTDAVPIATATTTAAGSYSFTLQPTLNSVFLVQVGDAASASATVHVKPAVQLRRTGARTFAVDVSAGNGSWFTKTVILQRFDPGAKTWKRVTAATLKANSRPDALVSVSSAALHAAVRHGTRLRAMLPQATVGSCYAPATSSTLNA
jgi:hypothetical protein